MLNRIIAILIVFVFGVAVGYSIRLQHEKYIAYKYSTEAERDLGRLEQQFHESWKKKFSFNIFQGQFHIFPIKNDKKEKQFSYVGYENEQRTR